MGLSKKQGRFVAEYLVDLNATAASIRAGYSEKTAAQIGHNLLQRSEISEAIQAAKKEREKRTEITQDYVIQKLQEICEMEAGDTPIYRVRVGNKIRALELLGKHLGLFEPKSAMAQRDMEDDPLTASLKEWMKKNGA